jgi:CxxC-x17-CxxC domain-containing protein
MEGFNRSGPRKPFNRGFGRGPRSGGGGGGGFRGSFGPRTMHKTTCSECKKECEVPFKPTEGRPVFCLDCFKKKKEADSSSEGSSAPSDSQDSEGSEDREEF